jgi:hypothetical protein
MVAKATHQAQWDQPIVAAWVGTRMTDSADEHFFVFSREPFETPRRLRITRIAGFAIFCARFDSPPRIQV